MANMSYCRFQNTERDLSDCVGALEDACDLEDLDLGKDETRAMHVMASLCQDFLDAYGRLAETAVEEEAE